MNRFFIFALFIAAATSGFSDPFFIKTRSVGAYDYWADAQEAARRWEEQKVSIAAWNSSVEANKQGIVVAWQNYVPEDPYRIVNGETVYARGDHWMKFGGRIVAILPEGIRVRGLCRSLNDPFNYYTFGGEFFVANFPYTNNFQILREVEYTSFTAKETGDFLLSGTNLIPKLDYGRIATPPVPSSQEIEAVLTKAEAIISHDQRVIDANAKALKFNQDQAAKGEAYGQFRMGERYLTGDGVEKDLIKARVYISKAAEQGMTSAVELLKNLPP